MPWVWRTEMGLNDIPQFCYCAFPTKIHHNFSPWQKQHFQFDIQALLSVCSVHCGPITVIHVENAIMRPQRWISSNWLANKHWNGWPTIVRKITTRWDIWGQIELDRNMRGGGHCIHIITAFCLVFFQVGLEVGGWEYGRRTLGGAWRQLLQLAGVLALPVTPQIHFPLEPFLAQAAGKWLVAGVLPHVSDQVAALWEGLGTHNALVRLLSWKRADPW